jgi:hypothetical protein
VAKKKIQDSAWQIPPILVIIYGWINGGIAQLGERLHGMQEVSSSILLISTNNPPQNLVAEAKQHDE